MKALRGKCYVIVRSDCILVFGSPRRDQLIHVKRSEITEILAQKTERAVNVFQIVPRFETTLQLDQLNIQGPEQYQDICYFRQAHQREVYKISDTVTRKRIQFCNALFTVTRVFNSSLMRDCSMLYSHVEPLVPNKPFLQLQMITVFSVSQHPNILQIYHIDRVQNNKLVAQCELLDDDVVSLREWLDPQMGYLYEGDLKQNSHRVLNVMIQIASAMLHLHSRKFVHGHLCPEVVLLAKGGRVAKVANAFFVSPIQSQRQCYFGGDIDYWSPDQENQLKVLQDSYQDAKNFRLISESELKALKHSYDLHSFSLMIIEAMFSERFWAAGSQANIVERFQAKCESVRQGQIGSLRVSAQVLLDLEDTIVKCLSPRLAMTYSFKEFLTLLLKVFTRAFPDGSQGLWQPYFDEHLRQLHTLNNLGVGFYVMANFDTAYSFFEHAKKLNEDAKNPDALVAFNTGLFESIHYFMSDAVAKRNLNRLEESAVRNLLIFAFQMRNEKFYNKHFFKQRQFHRENLTDEGLFSMLVMSYNHIRKHQEDFENRRELLRVLQLDKFEPVLSICLNKRFAVYVTRYRKVVQLFLWRFKNYNQCDYISQRVLSRIPSVTTPLQVFQDAEDQYHFIFSLENHLLFYKYDLVSNKITDSQDVYFQRYCRSLSINQIDKKVYCYLDDKQIWAVSIDSKEKKLVVGSTGRPLLDIHVSEFQIAGMQDDKALFLENLNGPNFDTSPTNSEKLMKVAVMQHLNLLLVLNHKQELMTMDLISGQVTNTFQLPVSTKSFICCESQPIIFAYGDSGYIEAYMVLNGTLIDSLGPFKPIRAVCFDEAFARVIVCDNDFVIRMFHFAVGSLEDDLKPINSWCKPCLVHDLTPQDIHLKKIDDTKKVQTLFLSMQGCLQIQNEQQAEDHLLQLFRQAEMVKRTVDLTAHPDLLTILKKLNQIKYFRQRTPHLDFNLSVEEFNYCASAEGKSIQNVTAFAVSPNQKYMAFGVLPGLTKLLYAPNQKIIYTISGNLGIRVTVLTFSEDSSIIFQATNENRIKAWDVERSRMVHALAVKSEVEVDDIAVNRELNLLLVSFVNSSFQVVELDTGIVRKIAMTVEFSAVNKLCFVEEEVAMSCGGDHNLRIWDLLMGRRREVLTGHTDKITCYTRYQKGLIATASLDRSLRIWALSSGTCLGVHKILEPNVRHISFSEDGRLLLATHYDMKVQIYDMAKKQNIWVYEDFEDIQAAYWLMAPTQIALFLAGNVKVLNILLNLDETD